MVGKPGGPCIFCGVTESSTWYGKKATADSPGRPVCRSNPCKEKASYKVRRKRDRDIENDDPDQHSVSSWESVSEVEACLGMR